MNQSPQGVFVRAQVSYTEAAELAYFGAKVLHPVAMQPAVRARQMPISSRREMLDSSRASWGCAVALYISIYARVFSAVRARQMPISDPLLFTRVRPLALG